MPTPTVGRRIGTALAAAAVTAGCLVTVMAGGVAQAADCARTRSDLNGDGFADLVVSAPRFVGGISGVQGAIEITYGSADGFSDASPSQAFTAILPAFVAGWLGHGLAIGYFDGDCYADLITDTRTVNDYADLVVIPGTAAGVDLSAARRIRQTEMIPGNSGGRLGDTLAVGDFNNDGFDDVAAGAPGWPHLGGAFGGVAVLYGSAAGLTASTQHWFTQDRPGVPGVNEGGDAFGAALAAADFTGDGFDDLAIGTPSEDIGDVLGTGAVTILKGSAAGIMATASQSWHQGLSRVPGSNERADVFGSALAAADFDHDGHADLAIGIPQEGIGAITRAGLVLVLRGAPAGLTGTGAKSWHQGLSCVPGAK